MIEEVELQIVEKAKTETEKMRELLNKMNLVLDKIKLRRNKKVA